MTSLMAPTSSSSTVDPMDISALEKDELRRALQCARDVHTTMKYQKPTNVNRMQTDLASIVIETIRCIQNDTLLHTSCLHRISRYINTDLEAPPIVKLGYALTVVIEKLMNDRSEHLATTTRSMDQASSSHPVESIHVNPKPVDGSGEVKDEPVDIKEEPLDDSYDIKEEVGEPEVDVFCPSTGTSRPLDSTDVVRDERERRGGRPQDSNEVIDDEPEERSVWTGMTGTQPLKPRKVYIVRNGSGVISTASMLSSGALKLTKARYVPAAVTAQSFPPSTSYLDPITMEPANYDNRKRRCYLCGVFPVHFETVPSSIHKTRRNQFLDRIIATTGIMEERVHALRKNQQTAHFCSSHIAVPLTAVVKKANKKSSCDLCDQPKYPLSASPANPITRRRFFHTLCNLTLTQQKRVDYLLKNTEAKATICAKHFKNYSIHSVNGVVKIGSDGQSIGPRGKRRLHIDNDTPTSPNLGMTLPRASPVRIDVGFPKEEAVKEEAIPDPPAS